MTRSYAAPCEEVFRAWTEASAMEQWFAPTDHGWVGCLDRLARYLEQ
jgi:uncharacterized protein YndB with AHSA1/START domain